MLVTTSLLRLFLMLFLATSLCQCAQTADNQVFSPVSKTTKQHSLSSAEYLTLANYETGNAKQVLLITAAMEATNAGNWRQAQAILSQTSELTPIQLQQKQILLAKIDLLREHYHLVRNRLASIQDIKNLPTPYSIYYHKLLAETYEHLGLKANSISERILLEALLPDESSRQKNRQALWSNLMSFPLTELQTFHAEAANNPLKGWIELALISKDISNATTIIKAIDDWQNIFPNHAANHLLPESLHRIESKLHPSPHQIALLLPLSGNLAGPGNAVKDGFLAAAKQETSIHIKVYDTQQEAAVNVYNKAINEGANFVVGPLSKADAASVAAINNPVPTLLLNEVDTIKHNNTYQFGLSPVHEASQVAIKASNQGYRRALIIAPEGAWAQEVANAFSHQWKTSGGQIVDIANYKNNADLGANIREALHVSKSEDREKQIKRLLGGKIQARPSRRNDIDMIFLLAYPSKARQIMPLLKYYYAGDLPVYATSTVYSGNSNSMKDKDLNGIIFCDMPWVFTNQMRNKSWPEQFNSYNRLYALGADSFHLVTQLNQLMVFPALGFNNKSGLLYLKPNNQIARMPEWGQFQAGQAAILG